MYVGIVDEKNKTLAGFITGIPIRLQIEDQQVTVTEVNFLCVKKQYRKKKFAAIMIKEIVRRSNLKGIWQGLYTSGKILPPLFCQSKYYHRSLNPKKLVSVGFSYLKHKQKMKHKEIYLRLPDLPDSLAG